MKFERKDRWMVSIQLDKNVFEKSKHNHIQTLVILGGTTSDSRKAKLLLFKDQKEVINNCSLRPLFDNKFISSIYIRNLKEGIYILKLRYPQCH